MTQKKVTRPSFSPPPPPPPVLPTAAAGDLSNLPRVGDTGGLVGPSAVSPKNLSEAEKAGLRLVGADPTKPVPKEVLENLPDAINRVKAEQARYEAALMAQAAPFDDRPPVNVEDLPAAEQAKALATMRQMMGQLEAAKSTRPAMAAAAAPSPPPARPTGLPVAPLPVDEPPQPTPPPADHPVSDAGGAGTVSVICPRCKFDCRNEDTVPVDDADKVAFLTCILASPPRRFSKQYSLFGGRLRVTFAELSTSESTDVYRAVMRRAVADNADGLTVMPARYYEIGLYYRAILSLTLIETDADKTELDGLYAEAKAAGLTVEQFVERMEAQSVITDSWMVVLRRAYDDFLSLTEKLRALAASPDFWPAIG